MNHATTTEQQTETAQADAAAQAHERNEAVALELLSLNQTQSLRTSAPIAVVVLVFAVIAWPTTPHALVIGWALLNWLAVLVRQLSWRAIPREGLDAQARLRIARYLPLVPGLANAGAVLFFPYLSDLGRSIVTLILAGLTTGGINSSAGYMPLYLAYLIPVMSALILGWAIIPLDAQDQWLGKAMVPMLIIYALTMVNLARGNFRIFKMAITKRLSETHLNQRLRAALDQAENANAAKTRFLAAASHDLRQPLHSLSLFFATLRLQITKSDNIVLLNHIDQALSALQSQMSTLLDMSKLDAGMVKLDWQSFALTRLLEPLRTAYQPVAAQHGIALHVTCPPHLIVNSDTEQLSRVLRNLVDNAVKYTSHGAVHIHAFEWNDQIKVRITDTGCGIAQALHGQVFEEFFQVDNPERDRNRGLGLGLSIVRRLAILLYLELELQSTPGAGTTVMLTIPRGSTQVRPLPAADTRDWQPSVPMCNVLVLDDEAAVRAGMAALLQRMGCEVLLAASIDEALAQAAIRSPDLVLADLRLRGEESGITAVQRLRHKQPGLPAIIITGDTAPDRLRQAQAANLPVLHKPVAADTLMAAIANSLDSAP